MGRVRFLTAGESHGQTLSATIEGIPAGLPLTADTIAVDLARPPIVGLVEPEWELRRLTTELAELDELTEVS